MTVFIDKIIMRGVLTGFAVFVLSLLAVFPYDAVSQTPGASADNEAGVHITADQMTSRQEDRFVEFSGNVRATQGGTVILSDTLTIHFKPGTSFSADADGEGNSDSVEKLVAQGNVIIEHENRTAFCEKAVYTSSDGLLVLTGEEVLVQEDGGSIKGRKVIFNRNSGEITVKGETGSRVEAVFEQMTQPGSQSDETKTSGNGQETQ